MPCTIIRNSTGGGNSGAQSTLKAANTFTGDVWYVQPFWFNDHIETLEQASSRHSWRDYEP